MALDPSIALGIKPVQIESPINQMAKMYEMQNAVQANKLNQLKMDEYTRGVAEDEAVRNYFAQQDRTSPDFVKGLYGVSPKIGQAYEKSQLEALKEKAAIGETEAKTKTAEFERKSKQLNIMGQSFGYVRTNPTPQAATMALNFLVSNGVIDKAQADEQLAVIAADPSPANIKALADQGFMAVLSAKEQLPTFQMQSTGGATRVLGINPVTGKADVVQGSQAKLTATPGELMTDARERERIRLGERRDIVSNQQVSDDGTVTSFNKFGEIIGTVKGVGKPSAQFTKTKEQTKRLNTDLNLAITELESATKDGGLIDQSTGSGLGRSIDIARGFVTGGASEGAIAGAKLGPIADLALKMVPRFEGPQSDKDTQSYKEAAGQLANTAIPNEIRKQAGRTVLRLMKNRKNQFVTQDMAQEGVVPSAGGDVDASNPLLK
jgi:hypothetical protein